MSSDRRLRQFAVQGFAEAERGGRELERAVDYPARRQRLARARAALRAYERLAEELLELDRGTSGSSSPTQRQKAINQPHPQRTHRTR
jgi:hypothetical protein